MTVHENKRARTKVFGLISWIVLVCLVALPGLVSVANVPRVTRGPLTQSPQSLGGEPFLLRESFQGPELDYSVFRHRDQRRRIAGVHGVINEPLTTLIKPTFPNHPACTNCQQSPVVTQAVPMWSICHVDVKSGAPPVKAFRLTSKESFNVNFDRARRPDGAAPRHGCAAPPSPTSP